MQMIYNTSTSLNNIHVLHCYSAQAHHSMCMCALLHSWKTSMLKLVCFLMSILSPCLIKRFPNAVVYVMLAIKEYYCQQAGSIIFNIQVRIIVYIWTRRLWPLCDSPPSICHKFCSCVYVCVYVTLFLQNYSLPINFTFRITLLPLN